MGIFRRAGSGSLSKAHRWRPRGSNTGGGMQPPDGSWRRVAGGDDGKWKPQSMLSCMQAQPAHALLGSKKHDLKQDELDVEEIIQTLGPPAMKNFGLSGGIGVITAISFKAVGRGLAVIIGSAYAIIQLGVYLGYVHVDWARVHKDVSHQIQKRQLRQKGKQSDFDKAMAESLSVLSHGVPSVSGFCAGFAWGLQL